MGLPAGPSVTPTGLFPAGTTQTGKVLCSGTEDPNPVQRRTGASCGDPGATEKPLTPSPTPAHFHVPVSVSHSVHKARPPTGGREMVNTTRILFGHSSGGEWGDSLGTACQSESGTPMRPPHTLRLQPRGTWEPCMVSEGATYAGPAPPCKRQGGHPAPQPCQPGQSWVLVGPSPQAES